MDTQAIVQTGSTIVKARPFANTRNLAMKNSPEILIGIGVAGILTSTFLACRATLKAPAALDTAKAKFASIAEAKDLAEQGACEYTAKDRKDDIIAASAQTAWEFTKIYAIPAAIMVTSLVCIFKGHGITAKRNAGLSAAVTALSTGYSAYRDRVKEKLGEEAESDLYYGRKTETIDVETVGKDGKVKIKKEKVTTLDISDSPSVYARFFDEGATEYRQSAELNRAFLHATQNYCNDKLRLNKVLFLNEVYDMLGLDRSKQGVVVGWAIGEDRDNFVDFGIFNENNAQARRFINGDEPSVLLDFNVDGVVMDML